MTQTKKTMSKRAACPWSVDMTVLYHEPGIQTQVRLALL